jgi:hypothetical protein
MVPLTQEILYRIFIGMFTMIYNLHKCGKWTLFAQQKTFLTCTALPCVRHNTQLDEHLTFQSSKVTEHAACLPWLIRWCFPMLVHPLLFPTHKNGVNESWKRTGVHVTVKSMSEYEEKSVVTGLKSGGHM